MAVRLGLERAPLKEVELEEIAKHLPVMITVIAPAPYHYHSTLIIGVEGNMVRLANYRDIGPAIEDISWKDIRLPAQGNINRQAWSVKLKKSWWQRIKEYFNLNKKITKKN